MKSSRAFTLIELLVVIAIIGLLAAIVMVSLNPTRNKAKIARSQEDLKQLRVAIELLYDDTGKWPNGCPAGVIANPEVWLDNAQAGLVAQPTVGVVELPCEWTANEVAKWRGPYVPTTVLRDPWGTSYQFDPDYYGCMDPPGCGSPNCCGPSDPGYANRVTACSTNNVFVAVLSFGADHLSYTCDDVLLKIF